MALVNRKIVLTRFAGEFRASTEIVEEPLPEPGPGEIVIENRFAGINAGRDILLCRNELRSFEVRLPFDMGVEAAGLVARVGAGVEGLRAGDAVVTTRGGGGYKLFNCVAAEEAIPVREPRPELLALLPSGYSASIALEECGQMRSGEVVLVTAAAGGAGHMGVQLARLAGNHVIGTCTSARKADLLREIGCERVVNLREEDLGVVLSREYPRGVDLVLDGVGGELFETCVDHLAPLGRLVVLGYISDYAGSPPLRPQPPFSSRIFWKSASVRGCVVPVHYAQHIPRHRARLLQLYEQGRVRPVVDPTDFHGLERVADAIEYQLAGRNLGKLTVRI